MSFLKWTVAGALLAALGACQAADRAVEPAGGEASETRSSLGKVPEASRPLLRPYPYLVDFPYEVVPNHFKPDFPEGWDWATVDAIYAESPSRVYVFQSGILPSLGDRFVGANGWPATREGGRHTKLERQEYILTVYDGNGNRIEHWKELDAIARSSHQLKVDPSDPDKHIWLVNQAGKDSGEFAILKYTREGKQLMTVGSDMATGCPRAQDIAFLPNGDFWCLTGDNAGLESDGVRKFTKDGTFVPGTVFADKAGAGPSELKAAHAILVDRQGRILISDRGNYRIQVFDENGKYLESWPNIVARSFAMDEYDRLWVICGEDNCGKDLAPHSMSVHDLNNHGQVLFNWGVAGGLPGQMYYNGQFDVDGDGNFYMGEVGGGRVQKWRPRAGANPDHLIPYPIVR